MRRLYQKLYLVFLASLLSVLAIVALSLHFGPANTEYGQVLALAGELAATALPPASAPQPVQQEAIARLSQRLRADIALFDSNLQPIAAAGRPLPRPPRGSESGGWVEGNGGAAWSFRLPDSRWVVARTAIIRTGPLRGLTKHIERLQQGVETLGAGKLATRVAVEGRDEVARLAASFNRAAERIEQLVGAHRLLLANASHELRTPLSRIRLGIELYESKPDAKIKAELAQDIAELDELIEEILLASRLDITATLPEVEEVDLLALAAEECARYEHCTLNGSTVLVRGDPRLIRRMIRNLLENAAHHGKPPITVAAEARAGKAVLAVCDAGPGIAETERERLFEPFRRASGAGRTGLGLALVREIAELHGGSVSVVSKINAGSTFMLRIPRQDAAQ